MKIIADSFHPNILIDVQTGERITCATEEQAARLICAINSIDPLCDALKDARSMLISANQDLVSIRDRLIEIDAAFQAQAAINKACE